MAKQWPEYMGTYKAMVLESGMKKTKTGFPQFQIRVFLTEYYDQKDGQWFDCSDNNLTMNGYFSLYGRKDGQADGEFVETLNHAQVCKVFEWDGRGFEYLNNTDFNGREVQVRVVENDYEQAKTPVQISWIDVADADPAVTIQKLDPSEIKSLETEFSHLWKNKQEPKAVSAKGTRKTGPSGTQKPSVKSSVEPETAPDQDNAPSPSDDKDAKRKALLEKSKRILEANKAEAAKAEANAAKKKDVPPAKAGPPAKQEQHDDGSGGDEQVPDDYGKQAAWIDIVEVRDESIDDETLKELWNGAIAEIADDGDEDKLDANGWWAVKEQVVEELSAS